MRCTIEPEVVIDALGSRCSFCGEFANGSRFHVYSIRPMLVVDRVIDDGLWAACPICDEMIEHTDPHGLGLRCVRAHLTSGHGVVTAVSMAYDQMQIFWRGWYSILN